MVHTVRFDGATEGVFVMNLPDPDDFFQSARLFLIASLAFAGGIFVGMGIELARNCQ
jgi:hypothetical protein